MRRAGEPFVKAFNSSLRAFGWSPLRGDGRDVARTAEQGQHVARGHRAPVIIALDIAAPEAAQRFDFELGLGALGGRRHAEAVGERDDGADDRDRFDAALRGADDRSEEHKSELQSLMRSSYAV